MNSNKWLNAWLPGGYKPEMRYMEPTDMEVWAISNAARRYADAINTLSLPLLDPDPDTHPADAALEAAMAAGVLESYLSEVEEYVGDGETEDGEGDPPDPTPDLLSARSELAMARHITNDLAERVSQRLGQLQLQQNRDSLTIAMDPESIRKNNEDLRKRTLAAENAATTGNAAAMDWLLEQLEDDADADHEPHRLGSIILAMAPHETYVMRRPEDPKAAERAKEAQTAYFAKAPFMEEHRPAFISDMARDLVPLPEIDQAIAQLHGVGAESEALHLWEEDTFHRAFMAYRHQGSVHVKLIAEQYDHPIRSEKALAHCAELDEVIISLADPEEEEGALAQCMRKMMSVNSANRTLAILHYHFRSQDMMDTAVRIAAHHGTRNTGKQVALELYDHQADAVEAALTRTQLDGSPLTEAQALAALEAAKAAGADDDALRETAPLLGLSPAQAGLPEPPQIPWEWAQTVMALAFHGNEPPQAHRWERMALAIGWNTNHPNLKRLSMAIAMHDATQITRAILLGEDPEPKE